MSIRGNGGTPRGHGDAKKAPKEKKARRQKWKVAPIEYPYDKIPEAQQFLTCSSCTADRMIDAVETYSRRSNDGEVCRVASCFPKVIYFTPPGVNKKPCKYELAHEQEQYFSSMMLYHHCQRQYPSVVFRQKLAPGQVAEVTVVIELHPTRAEDGQVQYEGTKLSGATAFKFTSPGPLLGQEIYYKARLAMPEMDGEPFSLTAPPQESLKTVVAVGGATA